MSNMTWRWTQHSYGKLLTEVSGSGTWKRKVQFDTFSCLDIRKVYRIYGQDRLCDLDVQAEEGQNSVQAETPLTF